MMLQLLQSPSARVQRVIDTQCNKKDAKKSTNPISSSSKNDGDEDVTGARSQDAKTSESRNVSVGSVVSSSSSDEPGIRRTNKVVDNGNGIVVASSSYSSSSDDIEEEPDDDDEVESSDY